jgi:hypothetical protein
LFAFVAGLVFASQASAAVVFQDNFNSENGGHSAANNTGFANWGVYYDVDLVRSGDEGITCDGSCVDMRDGWIMSKSIAFHAGERLTLETVWSGSQVGTELRFYFAGVDFDKLIDISDLTADGGSYGDYSQAGQIIGAYDQVAPGQPFFTSSLAFTPSSDGFLQIEIGGWDHAGGIGSTDEHHGPVLDRVTLYSGVIPEPADWALMTTGFALAGAALRRRRAGAPATA